MHDIIGDESYGYANICPSEPIEAGKKGNWKIKYVAGSKGILVGGSIRITIPHGFSIPQNKAFFEPGFTTIETNLEDIDLHIEIKSDIFCRIDKKMGHSGAFGRNIFVNVGKRALKEGDCFTINYGNSDYYGGEEFSKAGSISRELSGLAEFIVAVDIDGNRNAPSTGFKRLLKTPSLEILPSEVSKNILLVPSDMLKKTKLDAKKISLDKYNNPIKVEKVSIKEKRIQDFYLGFEENGNQIDDKIVYSNPFSIHQVKPKLKLYWGDIHGHTEHSDGLGTIDDYYNYAKNTAILDFSAITDHDDIGPRLFDEEWVKMREGVKKYNEPGVFIPFLGHEYRNGLCDMNIYYPKLEGVILRGNDNNLGDSKVLTQEVAKNRGMIIPHMHFGADWSGFDPKIYRLMEIYSQHGSAEFPYCTREIPFLRKQVQKSSKTNEDCYAHEILNLGYKLGFTAGSDTHSGRPGLSDWTRVCRTYKGGLTAIYAEYLTRESIWDALYNRRCYATTGNRSILYFSINNFDMGSDVKLSSGTKRIIKITCYPHGKLEKFTLYKSGKVWKQDFIKEIYLSIQFEDDSEFENDWYYVRIDLEGGEMVWSSPIWVELLLG